MIEKIQKRMRETMKKDNILTYLETSLEKALGDIDFAIDWNKRQHTIEVIIALYAENSDHEAIEDDEGVVSEEAVIEFQDSVLFYMDGKLPDVNTDDYLTMLSFDKKKGLPKAYLDVFSTYLAEVAVEGQSDLLDFLTDDSIEVFELHWDDEEFSVRINQAEFTEMAAYPSY
ncbi:DUF3013 family protein [Vagococcus vulneris]|nr:DUF3013 family protein [Vagococcus vulneris]